MNKSTMPVDIYWNLHKDCYSVIDRRARRVYCHLGASLFEPEPIYMNNLKLVVQAAGHRRVLEERRKNVHAFVRGTWWRKNHVFKDIFKPDQHSFRQVTYNPYVAPYWRFMDNGDTVKDINFARLTITNNKPVVHVWKS